LFQKFIDLLVIIILLISITSATSVSQPPPVSLLWSYPMPASDVALSDDGALVAVA